MDKFLPYLWDALPSSVKQFSRDDWVLMPYIFIYVKDTVRYARLCGTCLSVDFHNGESDARDYDQPGLHGK